MLACRSNDLLNLCRVALEAAIRDQNDLLALLPAEPSAGSTPLVSCRGRCSGSCGGSSRMTAPDLTTCAYRAL
jgi:hypothetical protein